MILAYHKVAPVAKTRWWITVDRFYEQMHALRSRQVVYLDDYDPQNPNHAVITFDGVYDNVHHYALPILRDFGYPFELFVIGDRIGGDNGFDSAAEPPCRFADEAMLEDMCRQGGRVQWHTRSHPRFSTLGPDEAIDELSPPAALAAQFSAPHLRWFAFPHGDLNPDHREAVKQRFAGALACGDGDPSDRHNLPRTLVFADTQLFRGTVAAIIANHNYGRFLREAVASLERQTSRPDEILIIDDASTDDSAEVLDDLEARGYSVIRNEQNLGIVGNFSKAVSLTNSDYLFFLGADNRLRCDYIMECRTALDRTPDIAAAYSDLTIFGPLSGKLAATVGAQPLARRRAEDQSVHLWRFPEPEGDALEQFAEKNFIHGSSMYRRSFYDKIGGYRDSAGPEDHHLFHRMWQAGGRFVRIAKPLLEYRQHSPGQANTMMSAALEIQSLRSALAEEKAKVVTLAAEAEQSAAKVAQSAEMSAEAIEQARLSYERKLRQIRQSLSELQEAHHRLRASRIWPFIRFLRPLRKRLNRTEQLTKAAQSLASAETPSRPLKTPLLHSRAGLIGALPAIAQTIREHGMRPGHWVAPEVTKSFQKQGFTLVANTFYAVTPDLNELGDRDWRLDKYAVAWEAVRCDPPETSLEKIKHFSSELAGIPHSLPDEDGRFYWNNPMFSPLDAAAYYGMIRGLAPRRILEVGSGYSTAVALMAAKRSERPVEISCIEPFPSGFLLKNRRALHTIIKRKVQDVDPLLFETLEAGDILFIDSSHCSRLGSDLNFLMFEAIPRLASGVIVHFHDIFLPSEYPRVWLEDIGIMWNEQYLVLAFLMFNKDFRVLWSSSIAGRSMQGELAEMFRPLLPADSAFTQNIGAMSGGSLWLRKGN